MVESGSGWDFPASVRFGRWVLPYEKSDRLGLASILYHYGYRWGQDVGKS